jgi:hypothetical protein
MAAITYAPNFQPPEYVDNVDRVQAGGPKGFNAQFQQLQAEFAAIATVVAQISAALDALAQGSVINPIPVNTANWSASAEFGSPRLDGTRTRPASCILSGPPSRSTRSAVFRTYSAPSLLRPARIVWSTRSCTPLTERTPISPLAPMGRSA